jgi:predicted PurR-regulated permease PerM
VSTYPPPITSPGWTARTKRVVILILMLLVGLVVWRLTDILPIIVVALVISYLLNPIATSIDRSVLSRKPGESHRSLAILITFILVMSSIVLMILVVLPVLMSQLQEFAARVPELLGGIGREATRILSQPIHIGSLRFVPMESLNGALGSDAGTIAPLDPSSLSVGGVVESVTGSAFSFVGGAFHAFIDMLILLTLIFYLTKDGSLFVDKIVQVSPMPYRNDVRRLFYELGRVWNAYLRGQLILSAILGVLVFIAATILGVPNPPILGLLAALFEFIPNLGPILALIPALILALASQSATLPFLEGLSFALAVIVVWTAIQNIEAVILVPRVMGGSLNLHPVVVMIGVLAGASLAGALGIILAAPVIASGRILGQYIYGKLTDRSPFPPPLPGKAVEARQNSLWHHFGLIVRDVRLSFVRAWDALVRWIRERRGDEISPDMVATYAKEKLKWIRERRGDEISPRAVTIYAKQKLKRIRERREAEVIADEYVEPK